ncbi:MAG TPA: alpha-glucosidase [Hyphomonadaceae bacterium]|nr:alpha-glucosidase [Hyphomonadaceae bacterium]
MGESDMSADWWRGAVIYQIYPRSFMDSDADGVGDLKGITSKLDYVQSLGVDGVWLSPFFKSPMRDFGYDVSDYCEVDPLFGSLSDFDALVKAAHKRDLKVIIDQVWSHTSSDHEWFQASRQDRSNPKSDWYVWADPKPDGAPPNNWQAWFGGPAWTWEPRRRQYYLHNFLPTQPDLNLRNEAARSAIFDIARFWIARGVDGFRLDVANYFIHDAKLRDNPPSGDPNPGLPRDMQLHQYNSNQPETLELLNRLRDLLDGRGGVMTVGELAPGSYELMHQYTRGNRGLSTAYAFDFLRAWPGVERMAEVLSQWREGPEDGWPSWAFSNHDVARVSTRWGEAIGAPAGRAAVLFLSLLLSLRGTIFLYQGEELGLPEADVPFEKLRDPWGINGWPATKGRDGCRTPFPWKEEANGGFTRAKEPWLPVDNRQRALAAGKQEALTESTLHTARKLIALRRAQPALARGAFKVLEAKDGQLSFERTAGAERIWCTFNFTNRQQTRAIPPGLPQVLWSAETVHNGGKLVMEPYGAAILKLS